MKNYNTVEIALREKGIRLSDIGRMTGYTISTVNNVIGRHSSNLILQDCIASLLGSDPEALWGLDYHPRARLLRRNTDVKFNRYSRRYTNFVPQTAGDRIRKARYEKQLRLDELAEATGIDSSALSRYETNERRPSRKTCERIGLALGTDPNYLLYGDGNNPKQPTVSADTMPDCCNSPAEFPAAEQAAPSTGSDSLSNGSESSENDRIPSEKIDFQRTGTF